MERREASRRQEPAVRACRGPLLPARARPAGGRPDLGAQIDRAHLERYDDSTGHFGCLAAEDDPSIFAALFAAAEAWLVAKGMKHVTGPFSLTVNEEVGLLIHGFDSRPS